MAIPNGVIFIWTGTNASIPAGWSRVTDLDDRFPKGHLDGSTNPNLTGGSATHTHTSPSHTHSMDNHTHTISFGAGTGGGKSTDNGTNSARIDHSHSSATSGAVTSVSVSSETATYSAISNNPPYYEVIFIKPSTVAAGLPNQAIGFSDDSSFVNNTGKYNGYYNCDGTNSTPNLANRYLKGASAGADAGGTGGSTTNTHDIVHTHSVSHSHTASTSSGTATLVSGRSGSGGGVQNATHTHSVTLPANTTGTSVNPSVTMDETVEPAYKSLIAIQNRTGNVYTPVGIIGMWLGTITSIPSNFELLTSMYDKHLKIGASVSDIGNTGGSNTHTHAAKSHNHTVAHTHATSITHTDNENSNAGGLTAATTTTSHSVTTDSVNYVLSSTNTTGDSSSNEPEYRTVAFIKYKGEIGGAFLFNLLR